MPADRFPLMCPENAAHVVTSQRHAEKHALTHWPTGANVPEKKRRGYGLMMVRRAYLLGLPPPQPGDLDAVAREELARLFASHKEA